ncbi:MAG: hypothetical protein R2747_07640 [Pyrinomonadaceae bacterium]
MQDVQNIPNPDINATEKNEDFGDHSEFAQDLDSRDIERPKNVDADAAREIDPDLTADEKKTHVIQPQHKEKAVPNG